MPKFDYTDVLHQEFEAESDRAAVILTASIFDDLLKALLVSRFTPSSSASDPLFDSPTAPLGNFSSRIEMAFRLGLISAKFTRDLHLIRKIRNDFAHNIHGASFDDIRVKSRVMELTNSHGIIKRSPHRYKSEPSTRDQFLLSASWMVFHLDSKSQETEAMPATEEEWGYSFAFSKKAAVKEHNEASELSTTGLLSGLGTKPSESS